MTVVALTAGQTVLALVGLALGAVVLTVVVALFTRVIRPALEIRRYADEILAAGVAIGRNLDGVDDLERTRELGGAVPDLAGAYLRKVGAGR